MCEIFNAWLCLCVGCIMLLCVFYLQHAPSHLVVLQAWKYHCNLFILFPVFTYSTVNSMAIPVLFDFLNLVHSCSYYCLTRVLNALMYVYT